MKVQYTKRNREGGYWATVSKGESRAYTFIVEPRTLGTSKVGAVDYWTARCPMLGVALNGGTRKEAVETLLDLILKERP